MNGGANDEDLLGFVESAPQLSEDLGSADSAAVAHIEAFSMDLLGFGTDVPIVTNGGSHSPPLKDPIDLFGSVNETMEDLIQITPPMVDSFVNQPVVPPQVESEVEQTLPLPSVSDPFEAAHPLLVEPSPAEPEPEHTLLFDSLTGKVETAELLLVDSSPGDPATEQTLPFDSLNGRGETAGPLLVELSPGEPETEQTLPLDSLNGQVETAEHLLVEPSPDKPETEQILPFDSLNGNETAEPLLLVPSALEPDIEQTPPFDSVSEKPETNESLLIEHETSEPSGSLESIARSEQKTEMSLLDVPVASTSEELVDETKQQTELDANNVDSCDEPLSENDAALHGKPLSALDPPEKATTASFVVDVDAAPTWASAVVSAAMPMATLDNLPTETHSEVASSLEPTQQESVPDPDAEALILELQFSIQEHLSEREAATERARNADERVRKAELRVQELEAVVQAKFVLEKELQATKESLSSAMADRENLLKELDKLREDRDEHERMQIVLSNRLNAAKKKEAAKANLAETLEDTAKVLRHDLEKTQSSLKEVTATKAKLAEELKVSTEDYEQRIKKLETLLGEERRLNEDRKKKMKSFVENKQEEVREAKAQNDELNMELSQTNRSLREHHARWKQLHAQWVQSQTRNRELQRDINRMKMESENMSRMGDQMNVKLSQRAQETETHKNKRLTAKQELMTVLETLEAEREVSSKLQDSIKFTFTPKALSQQQILKENLRDFEYELVRLSQRLGKPLPPSNDTPAETFALENDDSEVEPEGGTASRRSRSQIDATHLLSNLEDETQRVSQCIMALTANIERLHVLIAQSGERTCATLLSDLLAGTVSAPAEEESGDMAGPRLGLGTNRRYGQVPTGHD